MNPPSFDKEIQSRTWLMSGVGLAGWVFSLAADLTPERRLIAAGVGFIAGVAVGMVYDQIAFNQKENKDQ